MSRYSQLVPFIDFRTDYGKDVIESFYGIEQILAEYWLNITYIIGWTAIDIVWILMLAGYPDAFRLLRRASFPTETEG